MKNYTITFFTVIVSCASFGQSNTVSGGGDASGSGGSVAYSIGQIDYINASGSGGSINQGVQHPYELFSVGLSEKGLLTLSMYPNPTSDILMIESNGSLSGAIYNVTDMNGKLLLTGSLEGTKTSLNLKPFATGMYHLVVTEGTNIIESVKIIKN